MEADASRPPLHRWPMPGAHGKRSWPVNSACDLTSLCVVGVWFGGLAVGWAGGLRAVLRPLGPSGSGPAEFRRFGGGPELGAESAESQPGPVGAGDRAGLGFGVPGSAQVAGECGGDA